MKHIHLHFLWHNYYHKASVKICYVINISNIETLMALLLSYATVVFHILLMCHHYDCVTHSFVFHPPTHFVSSPVSIHVTLPHMLSMGRKSTGSPFRSVSRTWRDSIRSIHLHLLLFIWNVNTKFIFTIPFICSIMRRQWILCCVVGNSECGGVLKMIQCLQNVINSWSIK